TVKGAFDAQGAIDAALHGTGMAASRGRSGIFIVRRERRAAAAARHRRPADGINRPSELLDQSADPSPYIADIIVTAQKRAQSINDVGLTITALSPDTLQRQGV